MAQALAAGHDVVAVARRPEAVPPAERLTVHGGDVTDPRSIEGAFAGADAVVSAVGPTKNLSPGTILSVGLANLVAGCERAGVKRLVFQSGLMMTDGRELSAGSRLALRIFRAIFAKAYADKKIAEAAVQASALEWVIVRPPNLRATAATGKYVAAPAARISPMKALSFADCADCLVRAASERAWVRQIVNVGH